jgi:hypothetical protein
VGARIAAPTWSTSGRPSGLPVRWSRWTCLPRQEPISSELYRRWRSEQHAETRISHFEVGPSAYSDREGEVLCDAAGKVEVANEADRVET